MHSKKSPTWTCLYHLTCYSHVKTRVCTSVHMVWVLLNVYNFLWEFSYNPNSILEFIWKSLWGLSYFYRPHVVSFINSLLLRFLCMYIRNNDDNKHDVKRFWLLWSFFLLFFFKWTSLEDFVDADITVGALDDNEMLIQQDVLRWILRLGGWKSNKGEFPVGASNFPLKD